MIRILLVNLRVRHFIFFFCLLGQTVFGQDPYKDEDRIKMRNDAEELLKNYFFNLNQIGEDNPTARDFRGDDINTILSGNIENQSVQLYNDITRVKDKDRDYFDARDYLNKIGFELYKTGVQFNYITLNVKNPCYESRVGDKYYFVKIEILRKLQGIYALDNGAHVREDSIDVYIKFPILQNRPKLIVGLPKIYNTTLHAETVCEETPDNAPPTIKPFEDNLLKVRAELFVRDYALTLNLLGNPTINEIYSTTDYFENPNIRVYNDLFPQIKRDYFPSQDYFELIDKWFQQGIEFRYLSVVASNLLTEENYVSVQVDVDRVINVAEKGWQDRQKISIFVKFPIVDRVVGAERITPRIYKVLKREVKIEQRNYIAAGMQLNIMNYFGDLNPINNGLSTEWSFTNPSIGFHFEKKINKRIHLRANLAFGRIRGDDNTSAKPEGATQYRYVRNLHFRNDISEFSLSAIYDLKKNDGLHYRRSRITPYLFVGVGVFRHNPQAKTPTNIVGGGTWIPLQPLGTEGQGRLGYAKKYSLVQPVIPFGFGVKVKFNTRIDLGWEVGLRYTFTDYLDDVSGRYANPADLDDLANLMANRTLETTSALTGNSRIDNINRLNTVINGTENFLTFVGTDGKTYTTFNGYGRLGDQRGGSGDDRKPDFNDLYLMAGFKITYLLRVGKGTASTTQRAKVKYDFGK